MLDDDRGSVGMIRVPSVCLWWCEGGAVTEADVDVDVDVDVAFALSSRHSSRKRGVQVGAPVQVRHTECWSWSSHKWVPQTWRHPLVGIFIGKLMA